MRPLIWGTIFCIALAVGGSLLIGWAGFHADWSGALLAMTAAILALILSGMPPILLRGFSPMASVQVGLAATLIHMLVMLVVATVVLFGRLPVGPTFAFWLMAMYLVTLVALVASIVGQNRGTSPGVKTTPAHTGSHA